MGNAWCLHIWFNFLLQVFIKCIESLRLIHNPIFANSSQSATSQLLLAEVSWGLFRRKRAIFIKSICACQVGKFVYEIIHFVFTEKFKAITRRAVDYKLSGLPKRPGHYSDWMWRKQSSLCHCHGSEITKRKTAMHMWRRTRCFNEQQEICIQVASQVFYQRKVIRSKSAYP